ncbi:MAG: O-antigen ligase family protein [Candidatus Curtissbacteria bacterium]|nr:O-antigen ligase family protein [Candidatus Curtissbacteria bacterium]
MNIVKLLLILSLASIIPGQLIRIPISEGAAYITLSDIFIFVTVIVFLVHTFLIRKSLKLNPRVFLPVLIFSLVALASTTLAKVNLSQKEVLISLLFLARFILYFFIFIVTSNTIAKNKITSWLNIYLIVGLIFILAGFLQIIFLPDFTPLVPFGWDPHQRRLASTFLDPNFAGGLIALLFFTATVMYLERAEKLYFLMSLVSFVALVLTFSRSSYLALLAGLLVIGLLKSRNALLIFLIAFSISFFALSPVRARILGAFTLDETSEARIESWKNAVTIFKDNPIFGVGFNSYRFAQARYNLFPHDNPLGGHSGAGSDSSILLVAATTGIIGLVPFICLFFSMFVEFTKSKKAIGLIGTAALASLVIHSQFVNSLFFPQLMLSYWFILGLATTYDN